jgi:hypothetical protein
MLNMTKTMGSGCRKQWGQQGRWWRRHAEHEEDLCLKSPFLPLSRSNLHLLFTSFIIPLAGGGVIEDGDRAGGAVVWRSGLVTGVCGRRGSGGSYSILHSWQQSQPGRQRLVPGTAVAEVDNGMWQAMMISCYPKECLMQARARRPL